MGGCGSRGRWLPMGFAGILVALTGCGEKETPAEAVSNALADAASVTTISLDPRLHQPFAEAVVQVEDAPAEGHRPPERTIAGKSVGKLYTEVARRWDEIRFVSPGGKPLTYTATIDTELGSIQIALRPDVAPNHVRNFLALAGAGYYDGLVFERTIHEEAPDTPDGKLDFIETGCPVGTGEMGYGSIGYWLRRELDPKVMHEEGTIGACHGEHPDTAACKFYITLSKAPSMDGNYTIFGKVTHGLDTARKILALPVRNDSEFPEGDRPVKPVVIRKVTIQVSD